jgi:hypothetical protein
MVRAKINEIVSEAETIAFRSCHSLASKMVRLSYLFCHARSSGLLFRVLAKSNT